MFDLLLQGLGSWLLDLVVCFLSVLILRYIVRFVFVFGAWVVLFNPLMTRSDWEANAFLL